VAWPSSSCLPPPNVINGLTTLPTFVLSTLTYSRAWELTRREALWVLVSTSESGIHKLANSFASFQRRRWMELPSHLLWFDILLVSDSSLGGQQTKMQYISLTSIPVIYTLEFWVEHAHTWRLYEMEQSWHVIWAYTIWHVRWIGDGLGRWTTFLGLSRAETICTCPKARTRPAELFFQKSGKLTAPHRLDELKQVISRVHGGKYWWTWKEFRIAIA